MEPHWGPYDLDALITGITSALNGPGKLAGLGTYSITRVSVGNSAATGVMARAYQLDLSRGSFQIPPDEDIRTVWFNGNKDAETKSLNRIFSFPASAGWASSAKSTFVDLRRCHQIFIHTPGFGSYNSMGPKGQRDILAKVPVDVGYGDPLVHERERARLRGGRRQQPVGPEDTAQGRRRELDRPAGRSLVGHFNL